MLNSINVPMHNIYNKNRVNPYKNEDKGTKNMVYEVGEIITACITSKTKETISLQTKKNTRFDLPANSVQGEVGEQVYFEVLNKNKDEMSIKQIFPSESNFTKELTKQLSAKKLQELMTKTDFSEESENVYNLPKSAVDKEIEMHNRLMQALANIKRQVASVVNNSSRAAIGELVANGVNLNKVTISILSDMMQTIEENPFIEKDKTLYLSDDEINKIVDDYFSDKNNSSDKEVERAEAIVKTLSQNNMQTSGKNIDNLNSLLSKIDEVKTLTQKEKLAFLQTEKAMSLENLYITKHLGENTKESGKLKQLTDKEWNDLKPSVEKLISSMNLPENADSENLMEISKLLIANDVPLTPDSLLNANFLFTELENTPAESFLPQACQQIKSNKPLTNILVYNPKQTQNTKPITYDTLLNDLPKFTDAHIESLLQNSKPITLENLQIELYKGFPQAIQPAIVQDQTFLTAKRQLAEIQLKMTYEASIRLYNRNISINTAPLEDIVNGLRTLENEVSASILQSAGAEATYENAELLRETIEQAKLFASITFDTFIDISARRENFTIAALYNAAQVNKYEISATQPSQKYGDTFEKIEEQVAEFLESLGLEPDETNLKVAKILEKNGIEITKESVLETRHEYDKLVQISNKLHPMIAANMIKEGLNPLEMEIDDVLKYIDKYSDVYGMTDAEKIAEYIMEMDTKNALSEETRESMIAFYRMLNVIQKNDSAALGSAMKANKSLTLGNLMESAEYWAKSHGTQNIVDRKIDDENGAVSFSYVNSSIRSIIEREASLAKTQEINSAEFDYNKELLSELTELSEPDNLEEFIETYDDYLEFSLEEAIAEMSKIDEKSISDKTLEKQWLKYQQELLSLESTPAAGIQFMVNNEIPLTLPNISTVRQFLHNPSFIDDEYDDLDNMTSEYIKTVVEDTSLNSLANGENTPLDKVSELVSHIESTMDFSADAYEVIKLDGITRALRIQDAISRNESTFHLPVKINNRVTDIQMYILNEDANLTEQANIFMSLQTDLGAVQIFIESQKNVASLKVATDNPDALALMQANEEMLRDLVAETGYTVESISFSLSQRKNLVAQSIMPKSGTNPAVSTYSQQAGMSLLNSMI